MDSCHSLAVGRHPLLFPTCAIFSTGWHLHWLSLSEDGAPTLWGPNVSGNRYPCTNPGRFFNREAVQRGFLSQSVTRSGNPDLWHPERGYMEAGPSHWLIPFLPKEGSYPADAFPFGLRGSYLFPGPSVGPRYGLPCS